MDNNDVNSNKNDDINNIVIDNNVVGGTVDKVSANGGTLDVNGGTVGVGALGTGGTLDVNVGALGTGGTLDVNVGAGGTLDVNVGTVGVNGGTGAGGVNADKGGAVGMNVMHKNKVDMHCNKKDKIVDDIISDIKGQRDCSNTNKNLTIKIIDKIKNELTKDEIKKEIDIHLLKPLYDEINTNVLPILSSKLNNNLLPLVYNQIYEKVFPHYLTFIILLTVIIILLIVLLLFIINYKYNK